MPQRTEGNACGKIEPIAQEGHEGIDHEIRSARHLVEGLQDAPQCVPHAADRIDAERERARQGVPAVDGRKLALSRP